jgi:hypothetical protein
MERRLILRGLLSGLIAGLIAFMFARNFAEPQIAKAVNYESGRDAAQQALDRAAGVPIPAEGMDPFSRGLQANIGIGVGVVLFAVALGGLYAVAYSIAYGRVGAVRARGLALLVALGGFLLVYFVPFLKYPANPPAIGHEDTIGPRTALYLTVVVSSVVFGVLAVLLGRVLRRRHTIWRSVLLAGLAYSVLMGALMLLLPAVGELGANVAAYGAQTTETPLPLRDAAGSIVYPGFDADVLYRFRLYSVFAQLVLWGVLGLVFGALAERVLEPVSQRLASTQTQPAAPVDPATR